jgi:hypothetical protein
MRRRGVAGMWRMTVCVPIVVLGACGKNEGPRTAGATMPSTGSQTQMTDQKTLAAAITALPELELPDAWYMTAGGATLPERWAMIAAAEPGGPDAKTLTAKYANGGKPFKHTVFTNMPGPEGESVTILASASGLFVRVGGVELVSLGKGTLAPDRAATIARVVTGR